MQGTMFLVLLCASAVVSAAVRSPRPPMRRVCNQSGDQWRNTTVQVVEHVIKRNITWVTLQYQTLPECTYTCIMVTDGNDFLHVYDTLVAECGKNGCMVKGWVCHLIAHRVTWMDDEL